MRENDFFKSYQTAKWQRKKNSVLERDNYTCQICASSSGIMQVHHITYKHCHGKAYNAPMSDLITLCEYCHAHDDGNHESFFNGRAQIITQEGGQPLVIHVAKLPWFYWAGHIVSCKEVQTKKHIVSICNPEDGDDDYSVFHFIWVKEDDRIIKLDCCSVDEYSEIRLATEDEAKKYIDFVKEQATCPWIEEVINLGDRSVDIPLYRERLDDWMDDWLDRQFEEYKENLAYERHNYRD